MRALVTGFEPFGGDGANPSQEAVRRLPRAIEGIEIAVRELATEFRRSGRQLREAVAEVRPDLVLGVGLAGGRAELSLERIAINIDDARIPDNAGEQPIDRPIVPGGPAAYFATLPIKAAAAALRDAGLPAAVSNSAGTFVCNHVFYLLMHEAASGRHRFRGGFLHLPYLPSQAARLPSQPSLALDAALRGIEIILAVSAARAEDIAAAEGTLA